MRRLMALSRMIWCMFSSSLKNTPHVVSDVKSARLWASAAASRDIMTYSTLGGSSSGHSLHQSRLMIAASSPVGFCWYCAFHWNTGMDAFVRSSACRSKNSGHRAFCTNSPVSASSTSRIAGNSTTSYWSESSLLVISRIRRPVRSSWCHLVCTIATLPPGIRRVLAPKANHS